MVADSSIWVLALVLLLALAIFFGLRSFPKHTNSRLRRPSFSFQSRHHFANDTQLLGHAHASNNKIHGSQSTTALMRSFYNEVDRAIALDPRDVAPHILKALALDLVGRRHPTFGLLTLPLRLRVASPSNPVSAVDFKHAKLHLALNRRHRLDQAITDLLEAVRLNPKNGKAFYLLGECYEEKGLVDEARRVYETAIGIDNSLIVVVEALCRMSSAKVGS